VGAGAGRCVQRGEGLDLERVDEPIVVDIPRRYDLLLQDARVIGLRQS
jgi:hypothetical protein